MREALAAFLERAADLRASINVDSSPGVDQSGSLPQRASEQAVANLGESFLDRVFRVDGEVVSLRAMPRTPKAQSDALILLLYGYSRIKNQHDVTAPRLAQAAKQTGIQTERLDRILAQNNGFVVKAGFKKGVRYGLNNPGMKRCEELLSSLLG